MSRFVPVLAAAALCLFVARRADAQQLEPSSDDLRGPAPPNESLMKVVHVVIKPAMRGLGLGGSRK